MSLTSSISKYNPEWPQQFETESNRLRPIFGDSLVEIYHVGSTAVPGLSAKPEIDIAVVVSPNTDVSLFVVGLSELGYSRGSDLSVGHSFFKRDVDGVRTHKIHVCVMGHIAISRMLKFRQLLRVDTKVRNDYEALKLTLERTNKYGIAEYVKMKAPFIDAMMKNEVLK